MTEKSAPGKIGLWTTTALVVGNMVGSGVFLLPATLAAYGGISILGWIGSSIGAIFLAMLFSHLSKIITNSVGGPYAFTRVGLGDFPAYLVAWGYWFSIWCTNAAIAVTFVSYLTVFIPVLATNKILAVLTGISAVWFLTWVNVQGVKEAGRVQLITTILKLTPLVLISTPKGQEGIDLHRYCRRVVLYDLTWNPAHMEQRIGRVHRLGGAYSAKRKIQVIYCYQEGTYEELMAKRVQARCRMLHVLLGAGQWLDEDEEIDDVEPYRMSFPP